MYIYMLQYHSTQSESTIMIDKELKSYVIQKRLLVSLYRIVRYFNLLNVHMLQIGVNLIILAILVEGLSNILITKQLTRYNNNNKQTVFQK